MDPLSIAASVVALNGAVRKAMKVTSQLYWAARKSGEYEDDVKYIATQVGMFGSMVSGTSTMIQDHFGRYGRSKYLDLLGPKWLDDLGLQARYILRRIHGIKEKIPPQRTWLSGFLKRCEWLFNKAKREEICLCMDRMKADLQFIMIQLGCEALQYKIGSSNISSEMLKHLKRELKDTRRLIKEQMRTIRFLRERHENKYYEQFVTHEKTYTEWSDDMDSVLLSIGSEVSLDDQSSKSSRLSSTTGHIHDTDFATEQSSIHIDDDNSMDDSYVAVEKASDNDTIMSPSLSPQPRPRSQHRAHNSADFNDNSYFTREDMFNDSEIPLPSPLQLRHRPRQRARNSYSVSSQDSKPTPQISPPATPCDRESHSNNFIQTSPNLLILNDTMEAHAVAGYINKQTVTAKVFPPFPENIISQQLAVQLGLEILPHADADDIRRIDDGSCSNLLTTGTLTLIWSSGIYVNAQSRGFAVPCYVCDSTPQPLVFGKSFLDRQNVHICSFRKNRKRPVEDEDE